MSAPVRRSLAALAALAAATALAATPAHAQPACAAGTLNAYLAPSFQCTIGNWLLDDFSFDDGGGTVATGADASVVDPLTAMLSPFTGLDALGRSTFGFDFTGFAAFVGVTGGTTGSESATAGFDFAFQATSLAPNEFVARAGIDYQLNNVATINPGRFDRVSRLVGFVGDPAGSICLTVFDDNVGQTSQSRSREERCDRPRPSSVVALVFATADLDRTGGGTRPIEGSATAQLDRITLTVGPQVVPEPSTVALLATGLATLLGVAARRRRKTV